MKKTVWTFGLISGGLVSVMMLVTTLIGFKNIGFENGEIVGYTTMILSLSLVFFGIRSYRQNVTGGFISFGKAFKIGLLIALISSLCYVVSWMLINKFLYPEFMDEYVNYYLEKQKASGVSGEKLDAAIKEMDYFKELVKNPFIHFGITFLEIFWVGLVVTLISAAILKRKPIMVNG